MILFQLRISSRGNVPRPARLQTLLFQGQTHRINMLCLRGCAKTCVGIPGPRGALLTWSHCPPVRTTAVRKITLRSRNSAMFLTTKPGSAPRAFLQLAGAQPWSGALRTQLPPPRQLRKHFGRRPSRLARATNSSTCRVLDTARLSASGEAKFAAKSFLCFLLPSPAFAVHVCE